MKFVATIEIGDEAEKRFEAAKKLAVYGNLDLRDYLEQEIKWIAEAFDGKDARVEVRKV
jgi:hypothetical protein